MCGTYREFEIFIIIFNIRREYNFVILLFLTEFAYKIMYLYIVIFIKYKLNRLRFGKLAVENLQ